MTLLTHWLLTSYWDVAWLASEDGLTEWTTFVLFGMATGLAVLAGRTIRRLGHPRIGLFHWLLAALLFVVALEEISWGQRIFDWSTPQALADVNVQNETTLHNISNFDRVSNAITAAAAVVAMAGAAARLALHRMGRVSTADLLLPSLVLVPALLLILAWNAGGEPFRDFADLLGSRPIGDEAPELLSGLVVVLYSWVVWGKARALLTTSGPRPIPRPGPRRHSRGGRVGTSTHRPKT